MAGRLIKIDEEIVTSAVASVTLGGTNWDSSYDVYMVKMNNVAPTTDATVIKQRVTVGGVADTSANYDTAVKRLRSDVAFQDRSATNQTHLEYFSVTLGNATGEIFNGIMYLFNFNNASEYSFLTVEQSTTNSDTTLVGVQGGGVNTVAQSCDGVQFYFDGVDTFASGTFTLYGLKK